MAKSQTNGEQAAEKEDPLTKTSAVYTWANEQVAQIGEFLNDHAQPSLSVHANTVLQLENIRRDLVHLLGLTKVGAPQPSGEEGEQPSE